VLLLFLPPFTFPSSEESQVLIDCRVNRERVNEKSRALAVFWTFSTTDDRYNRSATVTLGSEIYQYVDMPITRDVFL